MKTLERNPEELMQPFTSRGWRVLSLDTENGVAELLLHGEGPKLKLTSPLLRGIDPRERKALGVCEQALDGLFNG